MSHYRRIFVKLLGVFTVDAEQYSAQDLLRIIREVGAIAITLMVLSKVDIDAIVRHFLK